MVQIISNIFFAKRVRCYFSWIQKEGLFKKGVSAFLFFRSAVHILQIWAAWNGAHSTDINELVKRSDLLDLHIIGTTTYSNLMRLNRFVKLNKKKVNWIRPRTPMATRVNIVYKYHDVLLSSALMCMSNSPPPVFLSLSYFILAYKTTLCLYSYELKTNFFFVLQIL